MKKRIVSLLLVLAMVTGMIPFAASAATAGTVYISISDDAEYITDPEGKPMGYVAVSLEKLAQIDLADYYLEEYIYDSNNDGVQDITALHLYIYVHEVLLELDWCDVSTSGSPGSIYLAGGLFGFFDENLRYDMNGSYPVDEQLSQEYGYAWGATADRIVLEDGDFLNVAHYSGWSFYADSATGFHYFTDGEGNLQHTYQTLPGEPLELGLVRSYSDWTNGGLPAFDPEIGYAVCYGKTYGEPENRVYSNEEGMLQITFPSAGTWYVWADGGYGNEAVEEIVSAPAFATVNVPDLQFALDLTELEEPVYQSGVLDETFELILEDMAEAGEEREFGFSVQSHDQYILYVRYTGDVVGWNINGTNYFAEDSGEGYVEWDLGNDVWTGCYFAQEEDGTVYDEFFLQLGVEGIYNTPGSWTVKPLVVTEEVLQALIAIDDIYLAGDEITLESGDAIEFADTCYNALSDTERDVLTYFGMTELLVEAQQAYQLLLDDQAAAGQVTEQIAAIGTVTLEKETAVTAARAAYSMLTDTQKALVTNYSVLTAAESMLETLKKAAADQAAADAVAHQITEIGTVTVFSDKKISAARQAFDALTDTQKALVENAADLTAAESALEMLYKQAAETDHEAVYEATGRYIAGLGTPYVGSTGGEWMVIDLTRAGQPCPEGYYQHVLDFVKEKINDKEQLHRAKSTDNSRVILALTAAGYDVTNVDGHDLLRGLSDMTYVQKQGINGPIWALIALDCHDYEIPVDPDAAEQTTREKLIAYILEKQLADGGWALSGQTADPDITGMAIQALAPYYKTNAAVKAAVDKGLICLSSKQLENGGFGSVDGICTESCAQVIVALTALGIDPETDSRFVKNGMSVVDAMCLFAVEGGGFAHVPGQGLNGMATEQGQYALAAYFRFQSGMTSLYNMTDVVLPGETVSLQISTIGTVTLESEKELTDIRTAYEALSAYQKTLVGNYDVLAEAEAKLQQLKISDKTDNTTEKKEQTTGKVENADEKKEQAAAGKVENTTDAKENACTAQLDIPATELADKLLTKEEKKLVEAGVSIDVDLAVADISKNVSAADKALVEKSLGKHTVGLYLDITLTKQLGDATPVKITETNGAVTVTIVVPENLRNTNAGIERTYQVVRVHEGRTDLLDTVYDAKTGKLSFQTDCFSTYALVYTDTAPASGNPQTGDSTNLALIFSFMAVSLLGMAALALIPRKKLL